MELLQALEATSEMLEVPPAVIRNFYKIQSYFQLDFELLNFFLEIVEALRSNLCEVDVLLNEFRERLIFSGSTNFKLEQIIFLVKLAVVVIDRISKTRAASIRSLR